MVWIWKNELSWNVILEISSIPFKDEDNTGADRKKRESTSRSKSKSPPKRKKRSRSRSKQRSSRRHASGSRSRSRSRDGDHDRRRGGGGGGGGGGGDDSDGYRLHVADLDPDTDKKSLERIFGKYGPLKEIWMAKSIPCFAFVVFRYREDAEDAQRKADRVEVCGRRMRVTIAKPRTRGQVSSGSQRNFDSNMKCYQCGERGHFSRDCPDTKYGYRRPPSPSYGRRKNN